MKTTNKQLSITSLLVAIKSGRVEKIRKSLKEHGLPKNAKKTTDYFALQTAVNKNQRDIVELLVDAGCRVNATDDDSGLTPLALAINNENEEIATLLLEKGANFEVGNGSDLTVFHLATENKSLTMMQLLLQYNVDINCVRGGKTAFQIFFDSSHPYTQLDNENDVEIFKLFLSKEASIDINHDWNVLHFVATTSHKDIIQCLVHIISDINLCTNDCNTSLHHLLQESSLSEEDIVEIVQTFILNGVRIDIANKQGDTAVHVAANKKYLKVLEVFCQYEWDVNCCNYEGNTVLHLLLENSSSYSQDVLFYEVVTSILTVESFKFIQNSQEKTQLHLAIENSHKQIVYDMLLKLGIDVNDSISSNTILHLYLQHLVDFNIKPDNLDIEVVKKLIMSMGARSDIITDEKNKTTPIHFALILKNKIILQLLLENFDFEKFAREQNKSILHYLSHNLDYSSENLELEIVEVIELCIKKGANVNFRDEHSLTPLPAAVLRRQKHVVKTLLENRVEINESDAQLILGNLMENEFAQITCCLNCSTPCNSFDVISIPENINRDIEIIELLSSVGLNLDNKSKKGLTIFHYAASKRCTEMLQRLLQYCRYPNLCDPNDNNLLHLILDSHVNTDNDEEEKLIEIVSKLLSKEASVQSVNVKGETPLHLAAKNKHFEIANILLQHGANATALDNSGNSMLHFLSMINIESKANLEADLMAQFITQGCDINAKNNEGKTPLLLAAQSGCTSVTRILLQYGAQIYCTADKNLSTPLHIAAGCNNSGVVEELIKFGVNVNLQRTDGLTALHLSASNKESTVTRILLENGADTEIQDNNGKTALHYACWNDSLENINELLNHGADVNAEDQFHVIPLMLISNSADIWTTLHHHIIKLQAANMFISEVTKKCVDHFKKAQPDDPAVSDASELFKTDASAEISKMKEIPLNENFFMPDLLRITPNALHSLSNSHQQQCPQEFLFSDIFEKEYPLYGNLIRSYYVKNIVRSGLLTLAKQSFKNIVGLPLDDLCYDKIFSGLSDHDLRQLDRAAKIRIRKRKNREHLNTVPLSKKRRRASF